MIGHPDCIDLLPMVLRASRWLLHLMLVHELSIDTDRRHGSIVMAATPVLDQTPSRSCALQLFLMLEPHQRVIVLLRLLGCFGCLLFRILSLCRLSRF